MLELDANYSASKWFISLFIWNESCTFFMLWAVVAMGMSTARRPDKKKQPRTKSLDVLCNRRVGLCTAWSPVATLPLLSLIVSHCSPHSRFASVAHTLARLLLSEFLRQRNRTLNDMVQFHQVSTDDELMKLLHETIATPTEAASFLLSSVRVSVLNQAHLAVIIGHVLSTLFNKITSSSGSLDCS